MGRGWDRAISEWGSEENSADASLYIAKDSVQRPVCKNVRRNVMLQYKIQFHRLASLCGYVKADVLKGLKRDVNQKPQDSMAALLEDLTKQPEKSLITDEFIVMIQKMLCVEFCCAFRNPLAFNKSSSSKYNYRITSRST